MVEYNSGKSGEEYTFYKDLAGRRFEKVEY